MAVPLKYLSNVWRSLDLPLINCEIELDLSWTKDSVLIEQNNNITGINFVITRTKRYVPVVTWSIKGTLMQIRKALYMSMFMLKYYPENFAF